MVNSALAEISDSTNQAKGRYLSRATESRIADLFSSIVFVLPPIMGGIGASLGIFDPYAPAEFRALTIRARSLARRTSS